ncbi:FAD-dependent oxidoreductase [Bradyrhizobium sp. NBAIM20]|uniref:FAD-dependent oxidoreductase n=1 Tax=unclassified Bradyrhizobium TaxID=2631580 RepID=UPI001CD729AF|nr:MULTISPECIES: FAD-dependent oxidoreductase [unclassified Bradyrhizobium]MCA1410958.1 FAD-dependent oxidoreductase [Bradyrhizobium sp. NBAIM20]MCA1461783.1 FAD-dependent oxidoreductase [Bradyrhizobium sp. NBAIM18]
MPGPLNATDGSNTGAMARDEAIPRFDVVVAGGGASGLIAAVSAARLGMRVLMIDRAGCLGGTATNAYVAQYVGFFNRNVQAVWGVPYEFVKRIIAAGGSDGFTKYTMAEAAANPLVIHNLPFNPEIVKIVADEIVREEGVSVLLHAQFVDVLKQDGQVVGVVVETVSGRQEIAARVVVDATGDALAAKAADVPMHPDDGERQPMTLVFRLSNVDVATFRAIPRETKRALALKGIAAGELFWESMSFVSTPGGTDAICLMSRIQGLDALDSFDRSEAERVGRQQIKSIVAFLTRQVPGFERSILASIAPSVGIRETRRIVGQYTLTGEDIIAQKEFTDAIALGCGPMDIHEPNGTGIALSMPPAPFEIPMRCLVPEAVEGLIVTGRAISATRDANGGARHMATAMALGQAAGTMAAIAVREQVSTRSLPVDVVRHELRAAGAALSTMDCAARTNAA